MQRLAKMAFFLIMYGLLTRTLFTQAPEELHDDQQAGRECGNLLLDQYVYVAKQDVQRAQEGFDMLFEYAPYMTGSSMDFFKGLQEQMKVCDVKNIISQAFLGIDDYARLLVIYYFVLLYCEQILLTEDPEVIPIKKLQETAYYLAAKTAYGAASSEILHKLKESVQEFERTVQENFAHL